MVIQDPIPATELNQLINQAQAGCQTAATRILMSFDPLICKLAYKRVQPWLREYMFDDVCQEMRIQALRAIKQYTPVNGCKFITYLYKTIDKSAITVSRRMRRPKGYRQWKCNDTIPELIPISQLSLSDQNHPTELPDTHAPRGNSKTDTTDTLEVLTACPALTPKERLVVLRRFRTGMSYEDIGIEMGCSRQAAHQAEQRAITKLLSYAVQRGLK